MESDKIKWRRVGDAIVVVPTPDNPIISLLALYGVQPSEIIGRHYKGDALAGEKFKDYDVIMFGVPREDERLPFTRLFWNDAEGGYCCWQFQIYWQQNHNILIDAMWHCEYKHYHVVTVWGNLEQLDGQTLAAMNTGMELLLVVTERMVMAARGGDTRTTEIKQLWDDDETLKRYARLVDELYPVWKTIKALADPCDSKESQDEWLSSMMSDRPQIKGLLTSYPKLTRDILRRAVDRTMKPIDREPRQLACYHAALELEVSINDNKLNIVDAYLRYEEKSPAPSTLKSYYDRGKALLK
jgi:hypothetical protein